MARTSIKDIAYHAGVSIATVSNSLRNPERVADATRERVLATVKELGYVPNRFGVGLRTARSNTILAIIPDISEAFYSGIFRGVEDALSRQGYNMLLGSARGREQREQEHASFASTGQVDGILLFSHRYPFATDANGHVLPDAVPVVSCCEDSGVGGVPLVSIDNVSAAMEGTRYLLGLGHSNIAVLTGSLEQPSNRERLQGFRLAMAQAGRPCDESNIFCEAYSPEFCQHVNQVLLSRKERPTAIFCFADEMAFACMTFLRQDGYRVPEDFAVLGFDGVPFIRSLSSPLSSLSQPFYEIGQRASEILLDMIAGKPLGSEREILQHKLYVALSTEQHEKPFWGRPDSKPGKHSLGQGLR